jgi:hypothetical protein
MRPHPTIVVEGGKCFWPAWRRRVLRVWALLWASGAVLFLVPVDEGSPWALRLSLAIAFSSVAVLAVRAARSEVSVGTESIVIRNGWREIEVAQPLWGFLRVHGRSLGLSGGDFVDTDGGVIRCSVLTPAGRFRRGHVEAAVAELNRAIATAHGRGDAEEAERS